MRRDGRPWLATKVYEPKRQRTVELVRRAVHDLRQRREKVSLASVSRRSRELDPEGKGVSESAILSNTEARSWYEKYRTWRQSRRREASRATLSTPEPSPIDPERDLQAARQRYLRMPKGVLVHRLLVVEQAYATERRQWLVASGAALGSELSAGVARHRQVGSARYVGALRRVRELTAGLRAKQEVILALRRELGAVYVKATGPGLTDNDLRMALAAALERAASAEREIAALRRRLFVRTATLMRDVDRRWRPR